VLLGAGAGPGPVRAATLAPAAAPTVSFSCSATKLRVGDKLTCTSSSTAGVGDTIASEDWTFGDGGSGSGHSASHTYSAPCTCTVTLKVTNTLVPPGPAESNSATKSITVVPNRPPKASITFTPSAPLVGQTVSLKSTSTDPDGKIASQAWDLDNNGVFDNGTASTVTTSFPTAGSHTVRLQVTDDLGATNSTAVNVVVNIKPNAAFTFSPRSPIAGDTVKFTSSSSDPDGSIALTQWDLNGDGAYDDAEGDTATKLFSVAGDDVVGVRVTDDRGAVSTKTLTMTVVANKAPSASFTYAPSAVTSGQEVTFTSTSRDSDGSIAKTEWDLDGDGAYNDATGTTVKKSFDAGSRRVSVKVTDDRGATDTSFQTMNVRDAAKPNSAQSGFGSTGPAAPPRAAPTLLAPFPVVSLRGRLVHGGAIITGLEVLQLAPGSRVEVRCRGRGCPFRKKVRTAGKSAKRRVSFPQIQHRLRAGVIIQVLVTKKGLIGKFTSFRIRGSTTPLRKDRCLLPGARNPTRCAR
jgi:plastocyanin